MAATPLGEMQFEILPTEDAAEGVVFGIGCDVSIDADGFKPGGPDWYTEDSENPLNGSTAFGQDHALGPEWQWSMHVNRDQTGNATESLREIATAWRSGQIRDLNGAVLAVRYQMAGRTRRVYGRPRRFEYSPNNLILNGYVPIDANFKCADSLIYDDEIKSINTSMAFEPNPSGTIYPVIYPVTMRQTTTRYAAAAIGGDEETAPVLTFVGPLVNPSIETENWKISLNITLGAADVAVVDARPWNQTVLLNDDTSIAKALGKRQWISDIRLKPNSPASMILRSDGGSGSCEMSWRDAYTSI